MKGLWSAGAAAVVTLAIAGIAAIDAYGQLRSQVRNNSETIDKNRAVIEIVRERASEERRAIGELNSTTRGIERQLDDQRARIEQIYRLLIEARVERRVPDDRPGATPER